MRMFIAIATGLLLAGGAYAQTVVMDAAKDAIRRQLKDPPSARFEGLVERRAADGSLGVCGQVNAKNAMGGYTGALPFVYDVAARAAYIMDLNAVSSPDFDLSYGARTAAAVKKYCIEGK
jgi:hypothetical protein